MNAGEASDVILSVRGLCVAYGGRRSLFGGSAPITAVDEVSFDLGRGEVLGLVGESGCGKSSLAKAVTRLTDASGEVRFNGLDLLTLNRSAMRRQRRHIQMIFQDPYASLDPRMTAGQIIAEPIRAQRSLQRPAVQARVYELMETVGLSPRMSDRYPREFSGGQRQRIGIARALASEPDLVVADEPISSLDVSIQAQIMNLLQRLQAERQLAFLFISHDLRAVRHLAARIAVMYLGKIIEIGPAAAVYSKPLMPYTRALISAVPVADPAVENARERIILKGDLPSPIDPPQGCRFHTRCPFAIAECAARLPTLVEIRPGHTAACLRINADHPDIGENDRSGLGAIGS